MVKHTQIIRRQIADKLSVFDHFVGSALEGLRRQKQQSFSIFMTLKLSKWLITRILRKFCNLSAINTDLSILMRSANSPRKSVDSRKY